MNFLRTRSSNKRVEAGGHVLHTSEAESCKHGNKYLNDLFEQKKKNQTQIPKRRLVCAMTYTTCEFSVVCQRTGTQIVTGQQLSPSAGHMSF